jgi:RHS repeat-associated protein
VTGTNLTASFVYDADGRQVKATINGETTLYVGQHYEITGTEITKYYFAGSQRIALRKDGVLNFIIGDHLGSSSLTTDADGNELASMRYKAWGETRLATGSMNTDYEFTGQRTVAEIGLHFYNARWYDSSLSRFAQADSIIPPGVQGLDRYAYVNNSPLNYVDPSGHMCTDPEDLWSPGCDGSGGAPPNQAPLPSGGGSTNLLNFQIEGNMQWTEPEMAGFNQYATDVAQSYANVVNAVLHAQCMATGNPHNEPCDSISPTDAFHNIHGGPVNVIRKSGSCGDILGESCWGFAAAPNEIWIFSNATPNIISTHPQLIVHELGHGFAQAGHVRGFDWVYAGVPENRSGYYGPNYSWQLSTDMAASEIYADMFLGWVYGKWDVNKKTGGFSPFGQQKAKFMYGTNTYVLKLLGLHP